MATKFYAVKVGRTTGIFNTWDECKKQVDGYPCATYKSFPTAAEAMQYLGFNSQATASTTNTKFDNNTNTNTNTNTNKNNFASINPTSTNLTNLETSSDTAIAYVDGSYNIATGEFGSGIVFFYQGVETHLSEGFKDASLATMRNVAGEIKGSEIAMKYAISKDIPNLHIYHDYEGISKWCTGEWKTNKEGTIAYKSFYDSIKDILNVKFVKVKGHSGDKYNDIADELAKKACGVI